MSKINMSPEEIESQRRFLYEGRIANKQVLKDNHPQNREVKRRDNQPNKSCGEVTGANSKSRNKTWFKLDRIAVQIANEFEDSELLLEEVLIGVRERVILLRGIRN